MKKILIFSTAYLPLIGGAEIAVKEITDCLSDLEFYLICARIDKRLPAQEKIGKVNVYRVGWGSNWDKIFLPILGLVKALFLPRPSAIWAIMASHGGLTALFFKLLHPAIPFLLTLQEGDSLVYIRSKMKPFSLWQMIFKKADYIQAISNYLAKWGKDMSAKCPIEVVPNGTVIPAKAGIQIKDAEGLDSRFRPPRLGEAGGNDRKKLELKKELNIQDNEKVIITTSRLVPKNGVGDLIEAIKLAIRNYQLQIKLLILGSGPLEENLKLKVKNLKLEDKVLFLGTIKPEEIPQYLSIADIFIRPSLSEGLGNSFLEALVAGVPIIGTPVGGIPDFLIDGETGLFCEVNNPQSIVEKINLLLSDEGLRQKLIANGMELVKNNYDWNLISKRMNIIFGRLFKNF